MRPSTPKASAASLPPLLLRLLPGGANQFPGGYTPAVDQRLFTAHSGYTTDSATPNTLNPLNKSQKLSASSKTAMGESNHHRLTNLGKLGKT
jgi:hypothetical protein